MFVKHWEQYFNKFVIGTLDLKHWKHCIYIQAWRWETFCLQAQRCETDSNKFCRRETFAVSAGTCIPVKMKKKCRTQNTCWNWWWYQEYVQSYPYPSLQIAKSVVGNKVNTEGDRPLLTRMVASHTKYGGRKMRLCQKESCTCKCNFFYRKRWPLDGSRLHCHCEYTEL